MSDAGRAAFVLRAMTPADVAPVAAIEAASFAVPWSESSFRHELDLPFSRALVAHPAAQPAVIAGYAILWHVADEVHLLDLAVADGFRQRGIGRLLAMRVLDEARARQARMVTLEVAQENAAGCSLYASLGFTTVQTRRDYYGPDRHALVMERTIRGA